MPYRTPDEYRKRFQELNGKSRALKSITDTITIDKQFTRKVIASSFMLEYFHRKRYDKYSILDVGCGQDLFLFHWLYDYLHVNDKFNIEYNALDVIKDEDVLKNIRHPLNYIEGSWLDIASIFKDKQFDIILWLDGPEHEKENKKVYRQMSNLLKGDGIIIISVPINCPAWGHVNIYNPESFRKEISRFFKIKIYLQEDDGCLPECIAIAEKREIRH